MVSKVVCLVKISNFADKHEAEFSKVTEISEINIFNFGLILTAKGCRGWVGIVSKVVCLIEISKGADNHETEFSMVTKILAKIKYFQRKGCI